MSDDTSGRKSKKRSRSSRSSSRSSSSSSSSSVSSSKSKITIYLDSLKRMGRRFLQGVATSQWLLGLPLSLLFLSVLTDYLVLTNAFDAESLLFFTAAPVQAEDPRRVSAEALQKTFQAFLYLLLLSLCALNWRAVYGYFREWPHILLILAMLLFSSTYSTEPVKVITNTILVLVSVLMPLAFAIGQKNSEQKLVAFYTCMLLPFIVSHTASLLLLTGWYSVNPIEFITSTNRYGGLSGNPNTLGNSAVIGIWACFAIILSPQTGRRYKIFAGVCVLVFANSIAISGSGTAFAVSVVVVILLVWMRFVSMFTAHVRAAVNIFATAFFVCGVLAVLVLATPAEIFLAFTDSMGKDATLTGRVELWDTAKNAISQKPWLGWSFDSHTSVMLEREFFVKHNHYHNGFLDTLVDGGVLLLALALYNLAVFARVFLSAFHRSSVVFALVVPGIMVVILNISEYSLLRPLSEIWQLYMGCFVLLTFKYSKRRSVDYLSTAPVKKKRREKSMRWA